MDQVEELITEFSNLPGLTISEKKKSLFHLFNKASSLQSNCFLLENITARLTVKSPLEELFYIEYLLNFHIYDELAKEIFHKNNETAMKKIAKEEWFFQKVASEGAPSIINNVHSLSFKLTLKFLNNLSNFMKEDIADELFDLLFKNYGLKVASTVISACSAHKITSILHNYNIKLSLKELKRLFDKNPLLIEIYLKQILKQRGDLISTESNPIFHYIANKNLEFYQTLSLRFKIRVKLGKKITKKFINLYQPLILENPTHHIKNLKATVLIRKLGFQFDEIFFKLFPRKIEDSPNSLSSELLESYPKKRKYELVKTTYNKIFVVPLENSPQLIDDFILKMMSDPEERERLAKIKNDDEFLKYYQPQNCLEIIKEKMNFARDPYERSRLMGVLTEACLINDDYEILLVTLKFINERFQNDYIYVQQKLVENLIWNKCKFEKFTSEHWTEIKRIMARDLNFRNIVNQKLFYKYLEFLIEGKMEIKDEIEQFFQKTNFGINHLQFLKNEAQFIFLATCLETEIATKLSLENFHCRLIAACRNYNLKNSKSQINILRYERIIDSMIKLVVDDKKAVVPSALESLTCITEEIPKIEKLRKIVFGDTKLITEKILKWHLKHKPESIQNNTEIFEYLEKNNANKRLCNLIKYNMLKIATDCCSVNLTPTKIKILSFLIPKESFFTLMKTSKSLLVGESSQLQFQIHLALLQNLKNYNLSSTELVQVMQFCERDFVPFWQKNLFTWLIRSPKTEVEIYLNEMKNHKNDKLAKISYSLVVSLVRSEKVKVIIKEAPNLLLNFFLRNPNEESYEYLRQSQFNIRTIKLSQVPIGFRSKYFELIWPLLTNENKMKFIKNLQQDFLLDLELNFAQKLIKDELFDENFNKLISFYFLNSELDMNKKILLIGEVIKERQITKRDLKKFLISFLEIYLEGSNNEISDAFCNLFFDAFSITTFFEETVILHSLRFSRIPQQCGTGILSTTQELISRFGETIIEIYAKILQEICGIFYKTNEEMYEVLYTLFKLKNCDLDLILLIKLLPKLKPQDKKSYQFYEEILNGLKQNLNPSVQLQLSLYFKSIQTEKEVSYYERINDFCINTSSWLCPGARKKIGYCYY